MQLWVNDVLKPIGRDGIVVAVHGHLNQLEVAMIKILFQKIIIEVKHSLLCQLMRRDSVLEWRIDCDM